jgi:hypothetical protein
MKHSLTKIKEEENQLVFRLDFSPENKSDEDALKALIEHPDRISITDQMIQMTLTESRENLIIEHKPDWKSEYERIKGQPSFYIFLKPESEMESF